LPRKRCSPIGTSDSKRWFLPSSIRTWPVQSRRMGSLGPRAIGPPCRKLTFLPDCPHGCMRTTGGLRAPARTSLLNVGSGVDSHDSLREPAPNRHPSDQSRHSVRNRSGASWV
jgi:hypothetical protein